MMFDSGSSETWIPANTCDDSECVTRTKIDLAPAEQYGRARHIVEFLSGGIKSRLVNRTLIIDNIRVPDSTINLVESLSIPVLRHLTWDGLVGLGFTTAEQAQNGRQSLIDHLKSEKILENLNLRNQFAYFADSSHAYFNLGGLHDAYKNHEIVWLPAEALGGYWSVKVTSVIIDNQELPQNECYIVFDTGTLQTYLPRNIYYRLNTDASMCHASTDRLPKVALKFGDSTADLVPQTLFTESEGLCSSTLDIQPSAIEQKACMTLGYSWFASHPTIFDWSGSRPMIGYVTI